MIVSDNNIINIYFICGVHLFYCSMFTTRKTQRGNLEVENMQNALEKVLSEAMSIRESALAYHVKQSTLARRV